MFRELWHYNKCMVSGIKCLMRGSVEDWNFCSCLGDKGGNASGSLGAFLARTPGCLIDMGGTFGSKLISLFCKRAEHVCAKSIGTNIHTCTERPTHLEHLQMKNKAVALTKLEFIQWVEPILLVRGNVNSWGVTLPDVELQCLTSYVGLQNHKVGWGYGIIELWQPRFIPNPPGS